MSEDDFARWMKRMVSAALDVNQTATEGRSLYQLSMLVSWFKVANALREAGASVPSKL